MTIHEQQPRCPRAPELQGQGPADGKRLYAHHAAVHGHVHDRKGSTFPTVKADRSPRGRRARPAEQNHARYSRRGARGVPSQRGRFCGGVPFGLASIGTQTVPLAQVLDASNIWYPSSRGAL
jgi:hypothetical protein